MKGDGSPRAQVPLLIFTEARRSESQSHLSAECAAIYPNYLNYPAIKWDTLRKHEIKWIISKTLCRVMKRVHPVWRHQGEFLEQIQHKTMSQVLPECPRPRSP
nr:uncharacterized protein LOC129525752 [Gorilla gorilla gorilla]